MQLAAKGERSDGAEEEPLLLDGLDCRRAMQVVLPFEVVDADTRPDITGTVLAEAPSRQINGSCASNTSGA
jgi:hypothetical protein